MHSLSFLEPSRQLELRMVHMVTLGVVALKQCSFSSGPRLRVILNPLGLTEASVEGWLNEITLSNRNSSFAAVMSQPCSPWGADAEGGLEWPCSMRHLSCRSTQIHADPLSLPQVLRPTAAPVSSSPMDLKMDFYPKAPGFTLSRQRTEVALIWGSDQGPAVSEDSRVSSPGTCPLYFSTV